MLVFNSDDVADASNSASVYSTETVDHDISRMENLLDQWTAELKKNVMVLNSQAVLNASFTVCH